MFARTRTVSLCALVAFVLALIGARDAAASVVGQWNYWTNQNANIVKLGLTGNATVAGGASVNPGTAVGVGVKAESRTGFLNLTGGSTDRAQTTESYTQYFGSGPTAVGASPNTNNFAAHTFV